MPMFWVCDRPKPQLYIDVNSSNGRMSDRASSERWPPDSSVSLSFHTSLNATFTSRSFATLSLGRLQLRRSTGQ
jgi:hypothetical protein